MPRPSRIVSRITRALVLYALLFLGGIGLLVWRFWIAG